MIEPISELLIDSGFLISVLGALYGGIFYIPYRIEKPKQILRKLKYLSDRSTNNGCITVFDLATEAEISPTNAKKALDKYAQQLEGEKLVSAKGDVYYLTYFGKYIGSALPGYSRNGQLRLAQFELYRDTEKRLELVKAMVVAKIHNQRSLIYRNGQKDDPLKLRKSQVKEQQTLNQVRGIEGIAAKEYFSYWNNILKHGWTFPGRKRRPPSDPVNALLSFAYGLLRVQVTAATHIVGLDPYIGYLHEVHHGQPAMVLDLMEEFRPLNLSVGVILGRFDKTLEP